MNKETDIVYKGLRLYASPYSGCKHCFAGRAGNETCFELLGISSCGGGRDIVWVTKEKLAELTAERLLK